MTIWVNEQLDPSGLLYSCIACCDETQAKECNESFEKNLTESQKKQGWTVRLRTVNSWDEVPVNALKLD
ncbi:MAG: glycogen debranching protein [Actinomycetota bacterium]